MQLPEYWMDRLGDVGALLAERNLQVTLVVIGGVALSVHGVRADSPTVDVDIIAKEQAGAFVAGMPLPEVVLAAAAVVALEHHLADDWLNAQSSSNFARGVPLPPGLIDRCQLRVEGGLRLLIADRKDLVALKLHAAVDRFGPRAIGEKHRKDLRDLNPTAADLSFSLDWLREAFADRPGVAELAAEIIEDDHLG